MQRRQKCALSSLCRDTRDVRFCVFYCNEREGEKSEQKTVLQFEIMDNPFDDGRLFVCKLSLKNTSNSNRQAVAVKLISYSASGTGDYEYFNHSISLAFRIAPFSC